MQRAAEALNKKIDMLSEVSFREGGNIHAKYDLENDIEFLRQQIWSLDIPLGRAGPTGWKESVLNLDWMPPW